MFHRFFVFRFATISTSMNVITVSIKEVFKNRAPRNLFVIASASFFLFVLLFVNGASAFSVFEFGSLSLTKKLSLFMSALFDFSSALTPSSTVLALIGSILGAFNMTLLYMYMKVRKDAVVRGSVTSTVGLFLAFLGVGCVACKAALVTFVFGLLGFSTFLDVLPYKGQEIGYLGLLVLLVATYSLAKKTQAPLVC